MDQMNELYYRDPYCREFDAQMVSCEKREKYYETVLSDTAFYPEGGGQAADHGTLNGTEVVDVQNHDGTIIHYTKEPVEGKNVHGVLDWNRRFVNMQMHTADHIFSGLIHRHFGYENVGFAMGEHGVRMDFSGPVSQQEIRQIELEANEAVWKNLPVQESFPSGEELKNMEYRSKKELQGKVRIITIPGVDVCACCGTHVSRTGEVGAIRIYSCEKYKSGVRVMMLAGKRALEEDNLLAEQNHRVSVLLSAEPQHTSDAVEILQSQLAEEKKKVTSLNHLLLESRLREAPEGAPVIVDFEEGMERSRMVHLADALCDRKNAGTAAVLNKSEKGWSYVIISRTKNLKELAGTINTQLQGRGGGKPEAIQGTFQSDQETIRKKLQEILQ